MPSKEIKTRAKEFEKWSDIRKFLEEIAGLPIDLIDSQLIPFLTLPNERSKAKAGVKLNLDAYTWQAAMLEDLCILTKKQHLSGKFKLKYYRIEKKTARKLDRALIPPGTDLTATASLEIYMREQETLVISEVYNPFGDVKSSDTSALVDKSIRESDEEDEEDAKEK